MGVVHGAWCVGCCWALMASLFALGIMSIPWMIGIAVLIAIEKLLPRKRIANVLVAATLVALGFGVTLAPANVAWLTLPGSPAAARAMHAMGMGAGPMSKRSSSVPAMGKQSSSMPAMAKQSSSMPAIGKQSSSMPAVGTRSSSRSKQRLDR